MTLCIGLMSGTSLDGVDGVLVRWHEAAPGHSRGRLAPQVLAHVHCPYDGALRAELLALNAPHGLDELHRSQLAANGVAKAYADVVARLLHASSCDARAVDVVGAHGQTVRHQPGRHDGVGYTVQLLQGALLAELSGIDVVCDFRSRDVAAGGQGAPLVPAFHAALFADPARSVAVLNLGGIANLTLLTPHAGAADSDDHANPRVTGFDCGPGNALMDFWCQRHQGAAWDEAGRWAAQGRVIEPLLARMLDEPFFHQAPPKSTGRDLFHPGWLASCVDALGAEPEAVDVQATLAELTARSAADAIRRHQPGCMDVLVCGGGARNAHLLQRLQALLDCAKVRTTEEAAGVPVDQVEALAFAWLAAAHRGGVPGNVADVTGAVGPRRLGALHPAR